MALQRNVIAPKDPAVDMSPNLNLPLSPAIRTCEFVSGIVAIDATGERMHGTVAAETRQILVGHDPGGFRVWWRALTGSDESSKTPA